MLVVRASLTLVPLFLLLFIIIFTTIVLLLLLHHHRSDLSKLDSLLLVLARLLVLGLSDAYLILLYLVLRYVASWML